MSETVGDALPEGYFFCACCRSLHRTGEPAELPGYSSTEPEGPTDERLTSNEVIEQTEAWDAFIARCKVEPTMGWVHAAFNEGFKARVLAARASSVCSRESQTDTRGLREAMEIIAAAVTAWQSEPNPVVEPPHWAATNALIQTIAAREGRSLGDVGDEYRETP